MNIEIHLTREAISGNILRPRAGAQGAWLEFRGIVRDEESGQNISALEYEAYPEMAEREIRRLLDDISSRHPCLAAKIIHRIGTIPVGETAIYAGIAASHRVEAIAFLAEFMDRLKQDVPIWKRRGHPQSLPDLHSRPLSAGTGAAASLDDALAKISSRCLPLPGVPVPVEESFGRVLRRTVPAPNDFPDSDRSTRDGYAVLENDVSESFEVIEVIDTLHAADWKPRQLKLGETVRVATGASLPCPNMRVIMQENVERKGDTIRILKFESDLNIRRRGEEAKAGAPLVQAGARVGAGELALLASAGCVQPMASPRLRVIHFTTGDEIVPPGQTPRPGQIRDSNSSLIRGLLGHYPCELNQAHLGEEIESALARINLDRHALERADVVLVSGGASVGDKDFTCALLKALGFEIVFSRVPIRPGRPTIFAVNGPRIAFGLPGNPLAHFVCFHLFVARALAILSGGGTQAFLRGKLAAPLEDALSPRETLWPARLECRAGQAGLHPLKWSSSGDVTCLTETNALLRIPMNVNAMATGTELDFLPA